MMWLTLIAATLAAPEVAVVGVHLSTLGEAESAAAAERIAAALEGNGKVRAVAPDDVALRIAGRQDLVLNQYALGPGRERLTEGQFLYDRAETDAALPVLAEAVASLRAGLAVSPDPRSLQDALVLTGLCELASGNESRARTALTSSLVLDPDWQLDPVRYPPSVLSLYDDVRAEVTGRRPARLTVTTSATEPATIFVDGRLIGPAPQSDISLPPGEHEVLLRGESGDNARSRITLDSGEVRQTQLDPGPPTLGDAGADDSSRSRHTREIYQALGAYLDEATVLLAGVSADGKVMLQLYSPRAGTFSKPLTADAGEDPVETLVDLAAGLSGYLEPNGTIASNRVSAQVVALDVNHNPTLLHLLFATPEEEFVEASRRPPWWLWAGIGGVAVAAGGVTAVLLSPDPEPATTTGTIEIAIP